MQARDWKQRVQDILEATARIERYTQNLTFEEFAAHDMVVDAVIPNIAVIGEAARQIPPEIESGSPHLPFREMRAMRNVVIHGYFTVSLPILWQTITSDLPPLAAMLQELLQDESFDSVLNAVGEVTRGRSRGAAAVAQAKGLRHHKEWSDTLWW